MSRAYLRLDPAFDEHKYEYPDGAYAALIAAFCLAELQPERGRFRSADYLSRLLGKRGRWVKYLLEHSDVVALDDGRIYVEGWDQWQEGDWKVAERVGRIRARRVNGHVTDDVTPDVTVPVTPQRKRSGSGALAEPRGAVQAADPADDYWSLTGRYPAGKSLKWIDDLTQQYGVEATSRALVTAQTADPDVSTLLGRTTDILRSQARALDRKERDEEQQRLREKRAIPRELPKWEQEFAQVLAAKYAAGGKS